MGHLSVSVDQGGDGLFEMPPVEPRVVERGPVDKTFRPFQPDQILLVPPSLDEWLPQDHLARFIADLVDEHLDLSAFYADYKQGRGAPPFDPRLMVRVLLLGYTTGVRSSQAGGGVLGQGGVPVARGWAGAGVSGDREVR